MHLEDSLQPVDVDMPSWPPQALRTLLITGRTLTFVCQLVSLAPVCYCTAIERYRTHWLLTSSACLSWLSLVVAAPMLYHLSTSLYGETNVQHTTLFNRIAALTMAIDIAISLLILGAQVRQRAQLARFLNTQRAILAQLAKMRESIISWGYPLLLWLKLLLSVYELIFNVPFFVRMSGQLGVMRLLAYVAHLYLQHLSSIYANFVFAAMLIVLSCLTQLDKQLSTEQPLGVQQLRRLFRLESEICTLFDLFTRNFELGIFLVIVGNVVNILSNLYAMLDYYVSAHGVPLTMSNYCLIVTAELYALIVVCFWCQERHRCLRYRLIELACKPEETVQDKRVTLRTLQLQPLEFSILGMFVLDHEFWLFLVSYSVNFIVIILQFAIENLTRD